VSAVVRFSFFLLEKESRLACEQSSENLALDGKNICEVMETRSTCCRIISLLGSGILSIR
jgi:hypothetical protein